jgi:SAM-dependent methyltransferase
MDEIIDDISKRMISRYSERYKKLGYDVRTLGWGTKAQQVARFEQVIKSGIDLIDKHVLDVGCGFGDLANFLIQKKISFKHYTGWDLNPDLINEAKNIWKDIPNVSFDVKNIASLEAPGRAEADIAIMLGVLNLNFKEELNNYEYSKKLIADTFKVVKDCLIVDFLSAKHNPDYPKEDFVFYHEPSEMLEFAFSLSQNIALRHNYMPIPQKEFMLFIYK